MEAFHEDTNRIIAAILAVPTLVTIVSPSDFAQRKICRIAVWRLSGLAIKPAADPNSVHSASVYQLNQTKRPATHQFAINIRSTTRLSV
jgi:hypothetical protein